LLRFEAEQPAPPIIPGSLSISGAGREWTVVCNGSRNEAIAAAAKAGGRVLTEETPSLDEIFVARASSKSQVRIPNPV
jgi:ABC-2 type transport system ATP-binding protein